MEIIFDKKSSVEGSIKFLVKEQDYQSEVDKAIKDYAKKANIKGFRVGKVPIGYIKKLHGSAFLLQTITEIIDKKLREYITDNKIRILGEPLMSNENTNNIDWDSQKEFEFIYDIGFVAVENIDINKQVNIVNYVIAVEEKNIEEVVKEAKERFATRTDKKTIDEKTEIKGVLTFGEKQYPTKFFSPKILDKKELEKLLGKTKDDVITISISKKKKTEILKKLLSVPDNTLENLEDEATLKIEEINQVELAPINQELFDKVFPSQGVDNEEKFREKIKEMIAKNYNLESRKVLERDAMRAYVKLINPEIPKEFLKRVFLHRDSKLTKEKFDKEFSSYEKEIQWEILTTQVLNNNQIEVEEKDVIKKTKDMIRENFEQYGQSALLDTEMDKIVNQYLFEEKEKEHFSTIKEQLRRERTLNFIIEKSKSKDKKCSWDKFVEYVNKTDEEK